jgi:hypothetical protein
LGQEKWQAGPSALVARLGNSSGDLGLESWNLGILAQHWWDYGGSSKRSHTNQLISNTLSTGNKMLRNLLA